MSFKEIIEKNYTGKTSFIGDSKVYFIQRTDLDSSIFKQIKSELQKSGFEISKANIEYDYDEDRKFYPYIEVKSKTNENRTKMKKSEATKFIKEHILSSLSEKKKGKKEDEVEDITADDAGEDIPPADDAAAASGGIDPNVKALQTHLNKAVEAAQALGDQKLITQLGNTITYFTRAHISKTETN